MVFRVLWASSICRLHGPCWRLHRCDKSQSIVIAIIAELCFARLCWCGRPSLLTSCTYINIEGKDVKVTIVHANEVGDGYKACQWQESAPKTAGKKKKKKAQSKKQLVASHTFRTRAISHKVLRRIRYRDWVNQNADRVHAMSDDRMGYVHVPDMEQPGFADFHRHFLVESMRDGLIIDVRWNLGESFVIHDTKELH